ncbi:MAG: L-histidine N(alpha)-methyltransferase [Deltaproteobacteria bacterium]
MDVASPAEETDFGGDVRAGLSATPKRLDCRYFYDAEGSRLFDAICQVPEYYPPTAEREILQAHAGELAAGLEAATSLWELGSGSAAKTRLVIEAMLARGPLTYVPIDISKAALDESAAGLLRDYPALRIRSIHGDYSAGLRRLAEQRLPKLLLWLGSNVGNFDRAAAASFLSRLRAALVPSDLLLLGVDLRKEPAVLEAAYDDAQGVTAAFNLNLLARINRELEGHFDLAQFRHRARYDAQRGCVEMHLVSQKAQRVRIDRLALDIAFDAGEAIHTESSYKYSPEELEALAEAAGLRIDQLWTDRAGRFADLVLSPLPR